jgi:hypothetical protein
MNEQQPLPQVSGPSNVALSSASSTDNVEPSNVIQAPITTSQAHVQDPLNSSMRDEPLLDESRHSSSGWPPIDLEMPLELRNINRNIEFMI